MSLDTEPVEQAGPAVEPVRSGRHVHPAGGALRRGEFRVAALLLGVAVGLVAATAQRAGSQFYADDFLYLQLAKQGTLSLSWLTIDNYGHFAPLTRLAYFAVERTIGLDYGVATVLPCLLVVTIFWSQVWMYGLLMGRRPVVLVLALVGATSAPLVRVVLWWGAAVHVLGAAAMMTLCVAAFVADARTGRTRYRAFSVAALAVGLLVQERPMLTVGYLVLIRYLFGLGLPGPGFWRPGIGRALVREAVFWLPWVVVEGAYLVYRLFFFSSSPQPGSTSAAVEFVGQSVLRGWAPSLVGSRLDPGSPLVNLTTVLGLLAFVAVATILVLRRRGAWRSLAFLVAIYVANLGIVAVGRLNVVGLSAIAADLQYYVDVHIGTVLAFTLGFATLPRRALAQRRMPAPARLVALLAVLALALSTAVTWRATVRGNPETAAHGYLNRAQSELHDRTQPYALMRTKLPLDVAPPFIDPFTDVTAVFGLDHDVSDRADPTAPVKVAVTDDGAVVTVHPSTMAVRDQITRGSVRTVRAKLTDGPEGGVCVSGPAQSVVQVRMPHLVHGRGLFYGVGYTSTADQTALLSPRAGSAHYNWTPTALPAGSDVFVVDRIDTQRVRDLALVFQEPVDDLCLTSMWVGRLAAEVGGSCVTLDDYALPVEASTDCDADWP